MKTKPTENRPEIEWDRGDHLESHDHMRIYATTGESADGRKWTGDWEECDGEFSDITNIEEE